MHKVRVHDGTLKVVRSVSLAFYKMVSTGKQEEWNKAGQDVVVLHQFPRAKKSPNFSPYCMKLET